MLSTIAKVENTINAKIKEQINLILCDISSFKSETYRMDGVLNKGYSIMTYGCTLFFVQICVYIVS